MPRKQELLFGTQASASDIEEIKAEFHPSNIINVEFALPVGAIITMSGNLAPAGYLPCDGTIYNIEDYPNLANYYENAQGSKNFYGGDGTMTFAVPDFRGEFLRGTGTNGHENQGSGAEVGVHQDGTSIPVTFTANGTYIYSYKNGNNGSNAPTSMDKKNAFSDPYVTFVSGTSAPDAQSYKYTTRPTNTSVLYCVKY